MPQQHNHIKPVVDPELIRRYLAGELDDKTMHLLERQALEDPFLAEALDGFEGYAADQRLQLAELNRRLQQRVVGGGRRRVIPMFVRWAAAAVVFVVAGSTVLWLWKGSVNHEIAVLTPHIDTLIPAEIPAPSPVTSQNRERLPMQAPKADIRTGRAADTSASALAPLAQADVAVAEAVPPQADTIVPDNSLAANNLFMKRKALPSAVASNYVKAPISTGIRVLKGRIMDADADTGMTGAIMTMGAYGTSTDKDGNFTIERDDVPGKQELNVFAVGYESRNLSLGSKDNYLNIAIKKTGQSLDESMLKGRVAGVTSSPGTYEAPQPQDGFDKFDQYLAGSLQYPAPKLKGKVRVSFMVQANGSLTDFKVLKNLRDDYDAEAIRAIKAGPQWTPASNGKPTRVKVDVKFK